MEIRPLRKTDSRLEVSRIYEESWKFAYKGVVPQAYLDGIPAGLWAASLDQEGRWSLVLEENWRARCFYEKHGFRPAGDVMEQEIGGRPLREVLYCRRTQ